MINQKVYSGDIFIIEVLPPSFEIYFTSDGSVTDNGFLLNWNCDGRLQKGIIILYFRFHINILFT